MNTTNSLRVRLTNDEASAFKQYADSIGETRSRLLRKYIREIINQHPDLLHQEQTLLILAIRQLVGIANNLNQITAAIHCGKIHRTVDENYLTQIKNFVIVVKKAWESYITKATHRWIDKQWAMTKK